jgi:hypothetical protein
MSVERPGTVDKTGFSGFLAAFEIQELVTIFV